MDGRYMIVYGMNGTESLDGWELGWDSFSAFCGLFRAVLLSPVLGYHCMDGWASIHELNTESNCKRTCWPFVYACL